jgi:hypothetical protein
MSIIKRYIPTRELLGAYLTFSPNPREVDSFETDMRILNPTLLKDSILEAKATTDMARTPQAEQRQIIHRIYTRKIKEFSSLYPFVFAVENAMRSALSDHLEAHFGRPDWWTVVRDAILAGKDHKAFAVICGKPASRDFIKQAFFTVGKLLEGPQKAKITGAGLTDEFYYCLTIGELGRLMTTDWILIRGMFEPDASLGFTLDHTTFNNTIKVIREARNELYHSNPIRNRKVVVESCERILNALNFHLGDYDTDLAGTQYVRVAATVTRAQRHLIPAR